ncbi:MAG: (2Fe-2S)-binding protein [Sedimentisphaerales bacterium]|nr:(2Fe-2S)-binding protein [Sedimentisphaerales bacterium]
MGDRMVCYCIGGPGSVIVAAIRNGALTLKEIQDATGACTGHRCSQMNPSGHCCSADILRLIAAYAGSDTCQDPQR